MKKYLNLITILLFLSFFSFSCSDSKEDDNKPGPIEGNWSIISRIVKTNIEETNKRLNDYLPGYDAQTQAQQEFSQTSTTETSQLGTLTTTGIKNGQRVTLKTESYRIEGDSVFVLNPLTYDIKMRGAYVATTKKLVITYTVTEEELRVLAEEIVLDPNVIIGNPVGTLTVTCSR